MPVHEAAAQGYEVGAEAYERGRPEYPSTVVQYLIGSLGIGEGTTVLDLGAGTGKLTRLIAPTRARLIAVEPVRAMRARLEQKLPSAMVLDGTAEAIPLEAESVDVAVVAQAFHWFDGMLALAEIGRVLKPRGRLALVWNVWDESVDWVRQLSEILDPHAGETPRYRTGQGRGAFEGSGRFTPMEANRFHHVHVGQPAAVVDRVGSISFIAALADAQREEVLAEVRDLLSNHPETRDRPEIGFPYTTDTFVCSRLD